VQECTAAWKQASANAEPAYTGHSGPAKSIKSDSFPSRCFYDVGSQTLFFNTRETASPGTGKHPKLCGRRIQMIQMQIDDCRQGITNGYFTANFRQGWPVLTSDWTQLFPSKQDAQSKKGQKVFMMASDGSRQSGPYGARCWQGRCSHNEFVGKRTSYHWKFLSAWKDQAKVALRQGEKSTKDDFHDGFRCFNRSSGQYLTSKTMRGDPSKSKDIVSCAKFYAPELRTTQLEIGLPPDAKVPEGWVQYPLDPDKYGRVWGQGWVEQMWARKIGDPDHFSFAAFHGKDTLAKCKPGDDRCRAPILQIRPRVALSGVYKAGDFVMTEEVHHAKACHAPTLSSMYGMPLWQDLPGRVSGRWKFVKAHLDLDKIWDYGWCELEEKSKRCKMDQKGLIWNGGTVLSFFGCERTENRNGSGTARLLDAPLAYLDPVKDATCTCTYPRCFGGELRSRYEIASAKGEGLHLKSFLKIGNSQVMTNQLTMALTEKLEKCCAFKTALYIKAAEETCGVKQLEDVCKATPNGYEPRFGDEGLGAEKHFPALPCVAEAWSRFEFMAVVDKSKFAAEQAAKLKVFAKTSPSGEVVDELDLQDALRGVVLDIAGEETSMSAAWPPNPWDTVSGHGIPSATPKRSGMTPAPSHSPVSGGLDDGNTCIF